MTPTDTTDKTTRFEDRAIAVLRRAEESDEPSFGLLAAVVWALLAIAEALRKPEGL
jgi:hypothetical protein